MAGRDLRPRPRPQRPLGHRPEGPRDRWAPPVPHQGGWAVPAKLGQRLYEKSKLGRLDGDGNLVLSSEEVLFCHWNRHVSLPSEAWLEEELEGDPNLLQRAVILDVDGSGGEILVINDADTPRWGLRWSRHAKPPAPAEAVADWSTAAANVDWSTLLSDAHLDDAQGRLSEWYIIDEEFDVTMYHVHPVAFSGALTPWSQLEEQQRDGLRHAWSVKSHAEMDTGSQ